MTSLIPSIQYLNTTIQYLNTTIQASARQPSSLLSAETAQSAQQMISFGWNKMLGILPASNPMSWFGNSKANACVQYFIRAVSSLPNMPSCLVGAVGYAASSISTVDMSLLSASGQFAHVSWLGLSNRAQKAKESMVAIANYSVAQLLKRNNILTIPLQEVVLRQFNQKLINCDQEISKQSPSNFLAIKKEFSVNKDSSVSCDVVVGHDEINKYLLELNKNINQHRVRQGGGRNFSLTLGCENRVSIKKDSVVFGTPYEINLPSPLTFKPLSHDYLMFSNITSKYAWSVVKFFDRAFQWCCRVLVFVALSFVGVTVEGIKIDLNQKNIQAKGSVRLFGVKILDLNKLDIGAGIDVYKKNIHAQVAVGLFGVKISKKVLDFNIEKSQQLRDILGDFDIVMQECKIDLDNEKAIPVWALNLKMRIEPHDRSKAPMTLTSTCSWSPENPRLKVNFHTDSMTFCNWFAGVILENNARSKK